MNDLQVGDIVWSGYFDKPIVITKIVSETEWYFRLCEQEDRAQVPLSTFKGKKL